MNKKKWVLQFNILFIVLLFISTIIFHWKPDISGKYCRPLEITSCIEENAASPISIPNITLQSSIKRADSINKNCIVEDYSIYKGIVNCDGSISLSGFYERLSELVRKKRKKIRIAYFGDSMIEGDLLTQDFRAMFQNDFGGSGVGFVPITSIVARFRQTINHSFSSDWTDINFRSENKLSGKLFISGHSFLSNGNSSITYRGVNYPGLNIFENAAIIYGQPFAGFDTSEKVLINGKKYVLNVKSSLNTLEIKNLNTNEIKIQATAKNIPFYGAAFESDSGVIVDNFSFRGITGIEFNYFAQSFLEEEQKVRPYDLLIFHYGPNLLFKPQLNDFSWYAKTMTPILQNIKKSLPGTDILIISTADKGASYNGEWKTAIGVEPLVKTQYNIACNVGAGFFNLYNAMGGEGSIVRWAQADTTLANKDYTHPNSRGAKVLANLLYHSIHAEYQKYESKRPKEN